MLAAGAQEPAATDTATDWATAPAASQRLAGENLLALARVQAQLDELDPAEANYLEGIELITSADGEFAPALIGAYQGLAEVFVQRGDFAEAVTVLEQARHISHRNFGLFNLDQADVLDDLSEVYEAAGDTREAQEMQRELLDVAVRRFGSDDPAVVPYYYRLAGYYELARMRGLARDQYERALEILREDPQAKPADTLKPLRELVRIDTLLGEQTSAKRQLLEVLEAAPEAPAGERAEAFAVLGDAELAAGRDESALRYYSEAFGALGDNEAGEALFGSPRMVNFIPPAGPVDWGSRRNRAYAWGSITARFRLSARGRAEQIQITASDPPGLMDARYVERLAEAVFRPRLVAGAPVATPRLRYSHEFRYFLPEAE